MSDLHLEFGDLSLPGGDILILAGDVCEAVNLHKPRFTNFFTQQCAKYNKVLYVMGNHEHYLGSFSETYRIIKSQLPDNVELLEKQSIMIDGVLFLAATLWTDANRENPVSMSYINSALNDYHVVKTQGNKKLRVEDTVADHKRALEFLYGNLMDSNQPTVVITHHAPSSLSVDSFYRDDIHGNAAYFSDLSELILEHPQIRYWIHGHMHNQSSYSIGETNILSNPRGYFSYEERAAAFDAHCGFDIN